MSETTHTHVEILDIRARERQEEIKSLMEEAVEKSLREELTTLYFINRLQLIETKN